MREINRKIQELGLPFLMDKVTPGKGNCFFNALRQQFARPEVGISRPSSSSAKIRSDVCDFALNTTVRTILTMRVNYNVLNGENAWELFFKGMRKSGCWAEGPVMEVAAHMLQRIIFVVSTGNTHENPYLSIDGGGDAANFPPLILGNLAGVHYQSYVPDGASNDHPPKRAKIDEDEIMIKNTQLQSLPSMSTPVTSTPVKTYEKPEIPFTSTPNKISLKRRRLNPTPLRTSSLMPFEELESLFKRVSDDLRTLHRECRKLHSVVKSAQSKEKSRIQEEREDDEKLNDKDQITEELMTSFNDEFDPEI